MSGKEKLASAELLKLAKKWSRLANQTADAEEQFMRLAKKEFPEMKDDNDGLAENLTYGAFDSDDQTRKRLTDIINGSY